MGGIQTIPQFDTTRIAKLRIIFPVCQSFSPYNIVLFYYLNLRNPTVPAATVVLMDSGVIRQSHIFLDAD